MLTGLMLAAVAATAPLEPKPGDWANTPAHADVRAAYPAAAAKANIFGKAAMTCTVASGGRLADCALQSESPAGAGFGPALQSLTGKFRLKGSAAKPGQTVLIDHEFEEDDLLDTTPDWLRKPTAGELNAAWPAQALRSGVGGGAVVECRVNVAGLLERCAVSSEQPAGVGFGGAALLLASAFRMKPGTRDGKPVPSKVKIPINFGNPGLPQATGSHLPALGPTISIYPNPPFDRTPSYAEVAAASAIEGRTAMRCRLRETGLIDDCEFTYSSAPRLIQASRELAKKFHVTLGPDMTKEAVAKVYVALSIQFVGAAKANPTRSITHAVWTGAPAVDQVAKLYPAEALKQGVKSGRGVVACTVGDNGGLVGCKATGETPANLGFGQAAVEVAAMMKMTLWGEEGLPTAGGAVSLPLVINGPEPEAAAK